MTTTNYIEDMKNMLYKAMPLCMLLTLGACSSDEEFVEAPQIENPAIDGFTAVNLSLNGTKGSTSISKSSRVITGAWEDGWTSIDDAQSNYSPSQVYPLNVVYAYVKPSGAEPLAKNTEKPLKFDLENGNYLKLYYKVDGDNIYLRDEAGTIQEAPASLGFDMIFTSQDDNKFELPVYPNLTTPNGHAVYAPAGDVLFRSIDYVVKVGEGNDFGVYAKGSTFDEKISEIQMHRCTSSFNTKLIITDFDFTNDASIIGGIDKDTDKTKFDELLMKWFEKYRPGQHDCNLDALEDIFEMDFDFDDDNICDIDFDDIFDDDCELGYLLKLIEFKKQDGCGNVKTNGHLLRGKWNDLTNSCGSKLFKDIYMEPEDIANFIFGDCKVKKECNKKDESGKCILSRCISWKEFQKKIQELKDYILGKLAPEQKEELVKLTDWEISTFIAPNKDHSQRMSYPNTLDLFAYDANNSLWGKAEFTNNDVEIVALTKTPRNLVDGVSFNGKPNNIPVESDIEYKGVGKNFNYKVSPFIFPVYTDGRYEVCFSLKQTLADGSVKQATMRFPIENRDWKVTDPNSDQYYTDKFMNQNISNFMTIVVDVKDFAAQWNKVTKSQTPRGASNNVIDLEENVLDVPFKTFYLNK